MKRPTADEMRNSLFAGFVPDFFEAMGLTIEELLPDIVPDDCDFANNPAIMQRVEEVLAAKGWLAPPDANE